MGKAAAPAQLPVGSLLVDEGDWDGAWLACVFLFVWDRSPLLNTAGKPAGGLGACGRARRLAWVRACVRARTGGV